MAPPTSLPDDPPPGGSPESASPFPGPRSRGRPPNRHSGSSSSGHLREELPKPGGGWDRAKRPTLLRLAFGSSGRGGDPWRRRSVPTRRSPWIRSALAFGVGLYLGGSWPRALADGVAVATALATLWVLGRAAIRPRSRDTAISVHAAWWVLPFAVGLGLSTEPVHASLTPGPHQLEAVIVGAPRARASRLPGRRSGLVCFAELRTVDGRPASGRVRLTLSERPIGRGDHIALRVWVRPGTRTVGVRHPSHLTVTSLGWLSPLDRLRARQRREWQKRFSPTTHPWLQALVLGERADLGPTTRARFRDVGQSHLLAISGLHLGLLATMLAVAVSRWGPAGARARSIAIAVLLIGYAGFAGADSSVVRATLLGALAAMAALRGRRSPAENALAVSFIALALFDPVAAGRLGFALTFAAVAGILLLGRPSRQLPTLVADHGHRGSRRARFVRGVRDSLRVSAAAWWGASIPLVLVQPDVVPLAPVFALLATPFIAVLLGFGVIALVPLPAAVDRFVTPLIDGGAGTVIGGLNRLIDLFLLAPGTPAHWPPVAAESVALVLVAIGLVLYFRRWTRTVAAVGSIALALSLVPIRTPVILLPRMGRGQSLIVATDRMTVAYDAGSVDRLDGGARTLLSELRQLGRDRFDLIVLSHPHADHVLALPYLVERGQVARVAVGPRFEASPLGRTLLDFLEHRGVPILRAVAGQRWRLGETEWQVLHPPEELPAPLRLTTNDDSVVVRISLGFGSLLLTGDLEEVGCQLVSPRDPIDLLLLPHHGRSNRRLLEWTRRIDPQLILASSVGAPAEEITALRADGFVVGGTSWDGTLRARLDHGEWRLERRSERGWHSPRTWSTVPAP